MAIASSEQLCLNNYEFLKHVFDTMPGKLVIRDRESRIVYANKSFAEPYGYTTDSVIGRTSAELWASKGRPQQEINSWIKEDCQIIETNASLDYVQEIRRANGEVAYFHNYKRAITLPDGNRYLLAQYADITERKRQELREAREDAAAAELAGIHKTIVTYAHQINNPLTGILALVQLMQEHPGCPGDFREMLDELGTAAIRIRDVVKQLSTSNEPLKTREYLDRYQMLDV